MKNEFIKYWHPERLQEKKDWHQNIIGVYHISSIGCSHKDLDWDEHSGPCLRKTYLDYTNPIPDSEETEGNLEEGKDHHKALQEIIKEWKPNSIIEKPLAKIFARNGQKILLTGSIDIEYHHLFDLVKDDENTMTGISIWDIKTALYTMPTNKYDKNITHFDQVCLYAVFDIMTSLHPDHHEILRVKIIYVNKNNKKTISQRQNFILVDEVNKFADCLDRAFYLDDCLRKEQIPVAEPMKWCKWCKYLGRCLAQNDVEPIMEGKNTKRLVGIKVKEIERKE